jgi:drug/metabolite transporter (DMT)-like permease
MRYDLPDRGRFRGIVLLVLSVSLFGVVDGLSKMLAETQSVGQILLARYVLGIPVLFAASPPANWANLFQTAQPGLQILRGMTPLVIGGAMVLAVRYLPLADATAILFAGPFLVVMLSARYLGGRFVCRAGLEWLSALPRSSSWHGRVSANFPGMRLLRSSRPCSMPCSN